MDEITEAQILKAAEQINPRDDFTGLDFMQNVDLYLQRYGEKPVKQEIEEIRRILDPLAKDFPIFVRGLASLIESTQEIEKDQTNMWVQIRTIQSRLDALEEDKPKDGEPEVLSISQIMQHMAKVNMLEEKYINLHREVQVLTHMTHVKLLEMWSRITDVRKFVGMPPESE